MKRNIIYTILVLIFLSCKDDINDSSYRNSRYVFYETKNNTREWRRLSSNAINDFRQGDKIFYFLNNGSKHLEIEIIKDFNNRIEKHYNNEVLIKEIKYLNDSIIDSYIKDGFHKEYYHSGNIYAEGNYVNNLKVGYWIEYHENGKRYQELNYREGKKNGNYSEYFEDGKLKLLAKFWNDKKIDTIYEFNKFSKIVYMEINNVDTIRNISSGFAEHYYNDGSLKKIINISNWNNYGNFKEYYQNGQLKSISKLNFEDQERTLKMYYENGQLMFNYDSNINGPICYDSIGNVVSIDYFNEVILPKLKK
jgi:antitoxin component YwqK of YwqJK toxin-antitoxin module